MNNYKKILLIGKSILILSLIALIPSTGLLWMFNINFWGTFLMSIFLQFISPIIFDKLAFSKKLQNSIDEYNAKPYKKYNIPLICQYCGSHEDVDVDLVDTTYKCENCRRTNAIYVTFTTAIISATDE